MYRVKLFDDQYVTNLEEAINNFLETVQSKPSFELIDIKYNSYPYGEVNTDYHSAMIIYKI
ncbi:sporulation protein Cse60 [Amphibacillus sediminis]|uniref:sporulation protein Cse60 n=1 Tax=Amphibacillus sediminis TaxID=360185 RepID=UPI0008323DA0|nr:sporulation protein Cse60 [Amphibacillus sediminis]